MIQCLATQLGGLGRLEVRRPCDPLILRGVTLSSIGADPATAILLDASLVPEPANPSHSLAARLNALDALTPKYIGLTAEATVVHRKLFLCGPYGAILRQVTQCNCSWAIVVANVVDGVGYNVLDEVNDFTSGFRTSGSMFLPLHWKNTIGVGLGLGIGEGTVWNGGFLIYQLPSTWSEMDDEFVGDGDYVWRDDFMGTSLDTTTKWTRTQSTAGNIEIDQTYNWLKCKGNTVDQANAARSRTSFLRNAGYSYVFSIFINPVGSVSTVDGVPMTTVATGVKWGPVDPDALIEHLAVGLNNGSSYAELSSFPHSILFNGGNFYIYEDGNNRGTFDSVLAAGIYRFRLTPQADGSCVYEVQGDNFQGALSAVNAPGGSSTWYTLTTSGSHSGTNTFYFGLSLNQGTAYLGDMKIYEP